jgi:hypothetical protein
MTHTNPEYGKCLSGRPRVYKGVTFRPYRRGILLYIWVSDCERFKVFHLGQSGTTYAAMADGKDLGKRFRSIENAMLAAVRYRHKPGPA